MLADSHTDSSDVSGIGVDDMFLLMSSWSENLPSDDQEQTVQHVPKILGKALASAGIGITITSLTDFLAFVIGTTSVFMSVTNFSLYAGISSSSSFSPPQSSSSSIVAGFLVNNCIKVKAY